MLIDIILFIFILGGFWLGFVRGVFRSLVLIVAYLAAFVMTLIIAPWLAGFLSDTLPMGKLFALIFGTIGLLVLLIFLIHYIVRRVSKSHRKGNLTAANKIIGGVIMMMLAIFFYGLLLWPINQFGMIGQQTKEKSLTYTTLVSIPERSKTFIEKFKPIFHRYWQLMENTIEESKSKETY